MANKFWRNLGGGLVNALVPGEVYNKHTGGWAPTGVMAGRIGAGVAGQLAGPAGSLAGMVANQYIGNTPEGFAFDQGIEGWESFLDDGRAAVDALTQSAANNSTSVGRLSPALQPVGALQYGPSGGSFSWQPQNSTPTTPGGFENGIFAGGEGNFGPGTPSRAFAGGSTPANQAQADYAKYGGVQNQFKGMSGAYASPNNFQTGAQSAIFGSGGTYRK